MQFSESHHHQQNKLQFLIDIVQRLTDYFENPLKGKNWVKHHCNTKNTTNNKKLSVWTKVDK